MGKKNKNKNCWDLTPEEQQRAADSIAALERKEISILDLGKVNNAPLSDNGLTKDLEELVCQDILKSSRSSKTDNTPSTPFNFIPDEIRFSSSNSINDASENTDANMEKIRNEIETEVECQPIMELEAHPLFKGITVDINDVLQRVLIDDGVSPTTVSLMCVNLTFLDDEYERDSSEIADMISTIFFYLISCKFPFAVIPTNEFDEIFKKYIDFDDRKFIIIGCDYYQLLYYMDLEERNKLLSIPDAYHMDMNTTLKFFVTLAYETGRTHNIFFGDNTEYITKYKMLCDNDDRLQQYLGLMDSDKQTVINDDNTEISIYSKCLDLTYLQKEARELLMKLTGDYEYDEDDDDDDEYDDDDEELEVQDKVDEKVIENISEEEMSELLGSTDNINFHQLKTETTSSNEEMVVPVIKKK